MVKVKPIKKVVRNYVLSTAKAVMNYRDHLVNKGFQNNCAMDNALEYGIKMLNPGLCKEFTSRGNR
ncbi:MAG: hypothetical protein QXF82_04630 [Nitrososphaeria archaeon]